MNTLGYKDFDAFGRWYAFNRLKTTGKTASPATVRTKQVHLAQVANVLELQEQESLCQTCCDRAQVEFLLALLASRMTPGAMRVSVYALLDYGAWAATQGLIRASEWEVRKTDIPPKNPMPAISVYGVEEMEQFVSAARGVDVRWWAFMAYLVDTGRRVGETLSLRWSDFRLEETPAYIELRDTKNGDQQYVPLTARLTNEVFTPENIEKMKALKLRKGSAPSAGDPKTMPFPWSYNVAYARFGRFAERAGLPNKAFHCFRHSVITDRLARGVPIQAVAALAGHRNVGTTDARYNHTNALSYAGFVERG